MPINFSKNWNKKLDCDYFTTIRLYTKEKIDYYVEHYENGTLWGVNLKENLFCHAKLVDLEVRLLKDIPAWMCFIDAGMNLSAFHKLMEAMYRRKPEWNGQYTRMIILCFQKVKPQTTVASQPSINTVKRNYSFHS